MKKSEHSFALIERMEWEAERDVCSAHCTGRKKKRIKFKNLFALGFHLYFESESLNVKYNLDS